MATPSHDYFQTQTQLRQTLDDAGLAPRKRYGQHFLIDRNLMTKLLDAADLAPGDCVLEVGAGTGSLTGLLSVKAGAVVAVEIDERIADIARRRLADRPNVTFLSIDALEKKSAVSPEVLSAVARASATTGGAVKLVANLPYDIATPLIVNLLIGSARIERFCITVQKEVAERFLARPGTADYGPVSIITAVMAKGRRICRAPPEAFWPRPRVDSAMVVLAARPTGEIAVDKPAEFALFVRAFFQHRRQTIGHLAKRLQASDQILTAVHQMRLDPDLRPEDVSVDQWVELFRSLR